ncbi:MAG TPA: MarR family winged helix-turn-helix transcriptional regulator [Actinomycetes bacterium]
MTVAQRHESHAALPDGLLKRTTYLLWKLGAVGRRRLATQLATVDLAAPLPDHRLPHLGVLTCLADSGPASQRETAERLGMDCSDIVAVLDDLERGNLVVRRRDERDRRRHLVTLTPAGRHALRRLDTEAERVEDALLTPLSDDEREVLHGLLQRVLAYHNARVPCPPGPQAPW